MLPVFLYLFAGATVVVTALVAVVGYAAYLRADRSFREVLARRGLQIFSMTFAENLELRSSDGIVARRLAPLALGSATPLTAPELQRCSVAEMPLPDADLVVCQLGIAQAVFGPFLPPRIVTGDAAFDAELGVFEPPSEPGAYRGSAPRRDLSWSKPDVLAALRASGFIAMQITDGQARIATDEKRGRAHPMRRSCISSMSSTSRGACVLPSSIGWHCGRHCLPGPCPDGSVAEHIVRPPHDVCRVSPTETHATDLGTVTAVVGSLAFASVMLLVAWNLFRGRAYLARLAGSATG